MRSPDDTNSGGSSDRFPLTRHSAILALRGNDEPARRRALELLTAAYWRPVYVYLRLKWRRDADDARDLTQGFFLRVLEEEVFADYDPAKARFRTFVRVCLDRFVMRQDESETRDKRGGSAEHLSVDFATAESGIMAAGSQTPPEAEKLFEDEWVRGVFHVAVDGLRDHCRANDKATAFNLFERYDLARLDTDEKATYTMLANELGLTVETVTNHLAYARREFRRIVLDTLRQMTASDEEFRDEAAALLGLHANEPPLR
ncbi:MAG: sigma-70 family RNA polymerase sigma factor [candidate division Zixibacteria bacterium]|nr:sigma-70 family RNA polymerase sigma factor [candidate division Zixibacteria bacterium]